VTVLSLLSLRTPADFADWYRLGAQYVHGVADTMGFDLGRFSETYPRAVESLRVGSDLAPRAVRSVAADFLADATYAEPYREWMPLWYELGLLPFNRLAERRLRRAARTVASGADAGPVSAPRFSRPATCTSTAGPAPGSSRTSGSGSGSSRRRPPTLGVVRPRRPRVGRRGASALVARTRRETPAGYLGDGSLSPPVRKFQHALFADGGWVGRVDAAYGLNSALFGAWERPLARERERLEG
jgi:hypothetical protein